jgi:hypothetical protein
MSTRPTRASKTAALAKMRAIIDYESNKKSIIVPHQEESIIFTKSYYRIEDYKTINAINEGQSGIFICIHKDNYKNFIDSIGFIKVNDTDMYFKKKNDFQKTKYYKCKTDATFNELLYDMYNVRYPYEIGRIPISELYSKYIRLPIII